MDRLTTATESEQLPFGSPTPQLPYNQEEGHGSPSDITLVIVCGSSMKSEYCRQGMERGGERMMRMRKTGSRLDRKCRCREHDSRLTRREVDPGYIQARA